MIMYLELATEGIIDPKSAISTALKHAKRLQELANDMLDVTKIELGKMDLAFEQSKLNDLISECVDVFRPTLSSNVAFSLNLDSTFDTSTIRADRRRLEQAFSNIISNAIKFTQNGSIEIKSTFDNYRNIAEVEISDSGKGIPIDILPKLFGKFVTTNKSESNKKGTGLGLFIAKAIIEAHGGSITAFNNSRGGATFKLEIPLGKGKKELLVPPDQSFLFQSPN